MVNICHHWAVLLQAARVSRLGNDEYEMWAHMFPTGALHVTLSLNSKLWDYLQIDIGCRIATEILES